MVRYKDLSYVPVEPLTMVPPQKYRLYGYTAFTETDSVFHRDWGVPLPQKAEDGLGEIVCLPIHSTGVGLLYYAAKADSPKDLRDTRTTKIVGTVGNGWRRILHFIRTYL